MQNGTDDLKRIKGRSDVMEFDKCPKCDTPLEKGELGAAHYIIWGKKLGWYSNALSGERIAFKPYRNVHLKALRCQKCRIVLFEY